MEKKSKTIRCFFKLLLSGNFRSSGKEHSQNQNGKDENKKSDKNLNCEMFTFIHTFLRAYRTCP